MTTGRSPRLELGRVLAHPLWLTSLAVLLVNDHVLKGSGLLPGIVTGKLSDLSGLFVAPALLAVLLRARTRHALLVAHVIVGVGFAALELSRELAGAADTLYGTFGWRWRQWSDPTDLLALAVLPPAFSFACRVASSHRELPRGLVVRALVGLGLLTSVASTGDSQIVGPGDLPLPPDCSESPGVPTGDGGGSISCEGDPSEDACDNGFDDDSDGAIDCDDTDCTIPCTDLEAACTADEPLNIQATMELAGSTLGRSSLTEGNCMGADTPDTLFVLRVTASGRLTFGVPDGHGLSVRSACDDWRSELACADAPGEVTIEVSARMASNDLVTVVVEALDPLEAGDFVVPVTFTPDAP